MFARRMLVLFCTMLAAFALFTLTSIAFAQDTPTIAIGQNTVSELTATTPTAVYSLTSSGGESALVQVLAVSPNFVPAFRILNPAGVEILTAPNAEAQASLTATASFLGAGDYRIEISGVNGTLGQFVLSLQGGAPLPEPVELTADQPVSAVVSSQTPLAIYHFSTPPTDPLVLTVLTDAPDAGLLITLYDETAAKTIAISDAAISGIALRLPATESSYRVEVHAGSATDTPYTICLGVCPTSLLTSTAQPTTAVPTPESVAVACNVTPNGNPSVNVRSGPGTQFTAIGTLFAEQSLPVLGQLAGGAWLQVSLSNGATGWVAASVTRLEGDCVALPVIAAPANAPLAPTLPPPTSLPLPTTASGGSTAPTAMPTSAPAPTAVPTTELLPDLSVTISYAQLNADGKPDIGYSILVRDVTNPFSYRVQICVDDNCIFEDMTALTSSSSGTSRMLDFVVDGRRITHMATVTVDSTNDVVESNESNNVASLIFQ